MRRQRCIQGRLCCPCLDPEMAIEKCATVSSQFLIADDSAHHREQPRLIDRRVDFRGRGSRQTLGADGTDFSLTGADSEVCLSGGDLGLVRISVHRDEIARETCQFVIYAFLRA
ncbi:Uncharacterised protein [Mycobacteroides abscessus]|nr:Uncharacterised protein [Mycobacteroides abscessus]